MNHPIPSFVRMAACLGLSVVAGLGACSGTDFSGGTGGSQVGGTGGAGGATGATTRTGGQSGSQQSGGSVASGGISSSGGTTSNGGASSSGGIPSSGGSSSLGGTTFVGGSSVAGGTSAAGGSSAKGGAPNTGGSTVASGGSRATGGITATGGVWSGGGSGAGGSTHTGVWKFMFLGNSITGSTCYPQLLAQKFKSNGHTNFQSVGTALNNQSCNGAPSIQTEGHGGYGVTYLPQNSVRSPIPCTKQSQGCGSYSELQTWAAEAPDIVLMHYGTNDCWDGVKTSDIVAAHVAVLAEFRKKNANVIFFVSKIITMSPSGCSTCASNVTALDNQLTDGWATTNSTATSPIYIVDQSATITPGSDTGDGVHPNVTGAQKMADKAYTAVTAKNLF